MPDMNREQVLTLRTGGRDRYSGMGLDALLAEIGVDADSLLKKMEEWASANAEENPFMAWEASEQASAVRWVCRGVPADLAVYRAQVDRLRSHKYPDEWHQLQRLRCGHDHLSRMSLHDLRDEIGEMSIGEMSIGYEAMAEGIWIENNQQYMQAFLFGDAERANILRWHLRGLDTVRATQKLWFSRVKYSV
jgi:hypothetical protein